MDRSLRRAALAALLTTAVGCGNVESRAGAGGSGGVSAGGSTGVGGVPGSGGQAAVSGGGSPGIAGGMTGGTGGGPGTGGVAAGSGGTGAGTGGGAAGSAGSGSGGVGAGTGGGAAGTGGVAAGSGGIGAGAGGGDAGGGVAGAGGGMAGAGGHGGGCTDASACPERPLTFRVLRVGDGQTALSAASAAVFVEERRTDGTLVSSVALPTTASGAMQPFTMAGAATSEGGLALSSSGHYVTAAGYATPPGTASVASTTATSVYRSAARIDAAGNIDTSTSFLTAESGYNARGAVSVDGAGIWISGASDVWYRPWGAAAQTGTTVLSTPSNVRWLAIFGGQLYGTSGSNGFTGVFTIGAGLPVTANQVATPLPGLPTTGASPYGFVFLDLDAKVAGNDTLYLADDSAGLQKWTFDGSSWNEVATLNLPSPVGFRGVAGFASAGAVTLMASTAESGTDRLVVFVDDGVSVPTGTPVATSPVNTMFRGVALSPHP